MASSRQCGPLCQITRPLVVNDGTMCLMPSAKAGSIAHTTPLQTSALHDPPDLSFLFSSCLSPKMHLTDTDYQSAATVLGVEVEAIKAVAVVESSQNAFDLEGRPTILFERHVFHKLTNGKYDLIAPGISNAKPGGYGKRAAQYERLREAYALAPTAALSATSWGRFQIMGFNYKAAGFTCVQDMVLAMTHSEAAQLAAFVSFVQSNKRRTKALQDKDWTTFAIFYNGAGQAANHYDTKIKAAYDRLKSL